VDPRGGEAVNTKALNSLADLICRAQEQDRTPMGIALAIDAAGRHMTPETAAEVEQLRARVAELEAQCERRRVRLVALQNDALSMRGSLSPMGADRKVPFPLGETLTPAVDWLIARVAELEALTPARHQTCRACGAGYTYGEPCVQCEFRARMAAETQARVRQPGLVGHDLPELGGQR
jgi:hypothetical protein